MGNRGWGVRNWESGIRSLGLGVGNGNEGIGKASGE